jgi:hypothetical protein
MTLGIMHPPDEHGPVLQCRRLYFTDEFLRSPAKYWSVTLPESPPLDEVMFKAGWRNLGWMGWPKGTLVKCQWPGRANVVWALTGRDFPLTTCHVFEGKWPD